MNTAPPSSSGPSGSPAHPGPSAHLPHARHLERLPEAIGLAGLARIRQAAYALPQVLRPADLDAAEAGDGSIEAREARLDALGLIQLQKAVAGQRPSRWIDPAEMAAALAHLDAIGKLQNARPLMLERAAALEALGIARRNRGWTRLIKHVMKLSEPGWSLPVLFRQPLAAEPVWAYYRSGDRAALLAEIGAPRPYPEAPALLAHIEALIARGRAEHAAHLASLLPRLQAECATPQGESRLEELQAACSRAYARWERQVNEADALQGLNSELAFQGYPDSFGIARKLGRKVQLFVGPPNSGKTHAAFERLTQAAALPDGQGAYLAPLRLLALEGRDRLVGRGVPCSLLTGEENVPAADARVVSSTIEMLATAKVVDVAVIDEGQMIFDPSRGWAWTQAIVAAPARELIIICSAYAVPAIANLLGLCGESATVREFERKQHVQLLAHPVSLPELRRGDTVVAFSRREVLKLRDQVAAGGHSVSVIYGALPPEVRRREAERFASGESDILVATDAIGMGLNLPVRRVLFSTLTKFDGQGDRALDTSEVHQIAGRAGRFGIHDEGHAGVLASAEPAALRQLREAMHRHPHAPRDFKAPVAPNGWHIDTISARLAEQRLHAVLRVFVEQLKLDDAHFQVAELEQMLELAEQLDRVAAPLPLKQRFTYAQAPVDTRTESLLQAFYGWAAEHAQLDRVSAPWFLEEVDEHSRLERMEQALRACTLWLWLDLRFPGVYGHVEEVLDLRERLNDGIELQLQGQRPLALQRGRGRGQGRRRGPR